ncbi:MAG: sigma factor-like helix-turn-helix DNA-binding protein, partial [Ruminococcus sp.]|nr:sigma factor-like helix-turn-helix DNA-binding protein [Ruminococcus sp.]
MSRSTLELTDLIGDKVAFGAYKEERLGDNSRSLEKMRQYMYSVIRTELTEQQRKCIMLLITEGKKQKEIAAELGLNQST